MRERPTGEELLSVARKVLREELMPLLPADRRYDALMVANAMAIAARQIGFGDAPEQDEREELARLLGEAGAEKTLEDLHRQLSGAIRNGTFDPGTPAHEAVHALLRDITVQNLRESAPRVLEAAGLS